MDFEVEDWPRPGPSAHGQRVRLEGSEDLGADGWSQSDLGFELHSGPLISMV